MSYRAQCERFYLACRRRLAPNLRYSQDSYEQVLRQLAGPQVRWLDLGCGHQVLPPWRQASEQSLVKAVRLAVGADRDGPAMRSHRTLHRRVCADIGRLPFAAGSFDLVTANMVVEHLDAPENQFREIARVLTPGGAFLFHTGNIFGYYILCSRLLPEFAKEKLARQLQGRVAADVYPTHYRANSPGRIAALADSAGLEVAELLPTPSSPQTILMPMLLPFELMWIRLTMMPRWAGLRTNLIVTLRKPMAAGATP